MAPPYSMKNSNLKYIFFMSSTHTFKLIFYFYFYFFILKRSVRTERSHVQYRKMIHKKVKMKETALFGRRISINMGTGG